jgi:hypothetical protein
MWVTSLRYKYYCYEYSCIVICYCLIVFIYVVNATTLKYSNFTIPVSACWCFRVCLIVFTVTFNNISVISWTSVLLVEETEDQVKIIDLSQATEKLYHIILYTSPWSRFVLTASVVIATDCIGSYQSNYHMITATTAPCVLINKYIHAFDSINNLRMKNKRNKTCMFTLNKCYSQTLNFWKCKIVI